MSETTQVGEPEQFDRGVDDAVLEIRDARVTFEMARGRAEVLQGVNLDIERGECLGIVGESGSGKSTFGSTLMDAVEDPGVLTGDITYYPEPDSDGMDILDLNSRELKAYRWEHVSTVSQASGNSFSPTLSVRRHFVDTFEAHNVDVESGMETARERLREMQLEPERILSSYQHELSGGEKQRAMIALSLVFDPEVLILDEPTVGLDLMVQRNILSLLYDIRQEYDLTMIYITHDLPTIAGIADRLAVMYAFDIVEMGQTREVLLSPQHPYTRMFTKASPGLETPAEAIETIPGDSPDPINVPQGCPFHPRCPIAQERCEIDDVELRSSEDSDHEVACFYPERAVDDIPIAGHDGDTE